MPSATPGWLGPSSDGQARLAASVEIARVYGLAKQDGHYVLVDRLWPRGVARATAPFDEWLKDVSPSTELRKWYGHRPERFEEFAQSLRPRARQSPRPGCPGRTSPAGRSGPAGAGYGDQGPPALGGGSAAGPPQLEVSEGARRCCYGASLGTEQPSSWGAPSRTTPHSGQSSPAQHAGSPASSSGGRPASPASGPPSSSLFGTAPTVVKPTCRVGAADNETALSPALWYLRCGR